MFYFVGLWEMWNDPEAGPSRTCTIITCEPNALMAEIHNRMPVILPPESRSAWLVPDFVHSIRPPDPCR